MLAYLVQVAADGSSAEERGMSALTTIQSDLYAKVTARIVQALEMGGPPWVRPWSQDIDTLPMNASMSSCCPSTAA